MKLLDCILLQSCRLLLFRQESLSSERREEVRRVTCLIDPTTVRHHPLALHLKLATAIFQAANLINFDFRRLSVQVPGTRNLVRFYNSWNFQRENMPFPRTSRKGRVLSLSTALLHQKYIVIRDYHVKFAILTEVRLNDRPKEEFARVLFTAYGEIKGSRHA